MWRLVLATAWQPELDPRPPCAPVCPEALMKEFLLDSRE